MYDKRLEQGMKNLKAIDGEAGERVIQTLEGIAPDVGRYILEFAFGDIYEKILFPLENGRSSPLQVC